MYAFRIAHGECLLLESDRGQWLMLCRQGRLSGNIIQTIPAEMTVLFPLIPTSSLIGQRVHYDLLKLHFVKPTLTLHFMLRPSIFS